MRHIATIIFLILLISCETSDIPTSDQSSQKKDSIIAARVYDSLHGLNEFETIEIKMICGEGGPTSPQFFKHFDLFKEKKYDSIKNNLSSDDKLNRIISAVIIEELGAARVLSVSDNDRKLINETKQLKTRYYLCEGCTGHYDGQVWDLFKNKDSANFAKSFFEFIKINIGTSKLWKR